MVRDLCSIFHAVFNAILMSDYWKVVFEFYIKWYDNGYSDSIFWIVQLYVIWVQIMNDWASNDNMLIIIKLLNYKFMEIFWVIYT